MSPALDRSVGVYVHIPFCERICPYCDFPVAAARPLLPAHEDRYVDALLRELDARRPVFAGRALASVYLGGGTPSLLTPASVARLIEAVRESFPETQPAPDAALAAPELTLEVNPSTVERARLPGFREAGVNRVSVGVQSFDDTVLRRLGRAHRADEGCRSLEACREAGFEAVSLDLIFGAPGQTRAGLEDDLKQALDFAPEHVSAYELTIESGTPFATAAARGQLDLPAEDEAVDFIGSVESRLEAAGLHRYEISSYARPGYEAIHNRRYWQRRPVLGLGVGAVSSDPPDGEGAGIRRTNPRGVDAYLERVFGDRPAEVGLQERLDARSTRGEAVFLALRTAHGLNARSFAEEFGGSPRAFYAGAIEDLVGAGLLSEAACGDLELSPRGRLLSDSVFAYFV